MGFIAQFLAGGLQRGSNVKIRHSREFNGWRYPLPFHDGVTVTCAPESDVPQVTASVFCCRTIPSLHTLDNASLACDTMHKHSIEANTVIILFMICD